MVDRFYGYQSETSPRKIQTEYRPYKNKYSDGKSTTLQNKAIKTNHSKIEKQPARNTKITYSQNKAGVQNKREIKARTVVYVALVFSVLFVIIYRNSVINETFSQKEEIKNNVASIEKTNEQLQVSIENNLNLTSIEKEAKERVGMQKLDNAQKVYISLDKRDFVEVAAEEIILEEETNIFERLLKSFTEMI